VASPIHPLLADQIGKVGEEPRNVETTIDVKGEAKYDKTAKGKLDDSEFAIIDENKKATEGSEEIVIERGGRMGSTPRC
jgi:hypothetical protein